MTQKEIKEEIRSMKRMMESCYAYGGIAKTNYNYEIYILPYKKILGAKLFNKIYNEQVKHFKDCKVRINVYEDSEGLTYNSIEYQAT